MWKVNLDLNFVDLAGCGGDGRVKCYLQFAEGVTGGGTNRGHLSSWVMEICLRCMSTLMVCTREVEQNTERICVVLLLSCRAYLA